MFESSLIDLETSQQSRRKWAPLPIALALHGAVLATVCVAQVWNVEAVGEPETVVPYHVVSLPEIPAASTGARPTQPTTPVRPQTPVQPDIRQIPDEPVLDPAPHTSTGPAVLDGPPTEGLEEYSVNVGPSNGPFPSTGPSDAPIVVVPVAAPPQDEILTVGGAVSRPVLRTGQPPRFPQIGRHARIQGDVILQAVIDERGRVSDVRVLRGLPMGIDQAAVDAVQSWIFEPAKLNGRPVRVYYTLTVKFQLKG
jgi:periplasmic protein TonB